MQAAAVFLRHTGAGRFAKFANRFSGLPSDFGERLLKASSSVRVCLSRDDAGGIETSFEVSGETELLGLELALELLREFAAGGKGGRDDR
jgi:hypothetical protein